MKLSELKRIVDLYYRPDHPEDPTVVIQIKLPYNTVGPMPTILVENVMMGIDWDSGKFILRPTEELTPSDRNFAKKMQEMQTKVGDLTYENRRLKAEIRMLKKKLKRHEED